MSAGFSWLGHGCLPLRHFALCVAADSPQLRRKQKPAARQPRQLRDVKQSTPQRALAPVPSLGF